MNFARYLFALLAILFAINAFWLFGNTHELVRKISTHDFRAFQTAVDPHFGSFLTVLSLYGFWQDAFLLPRDLFALWWVGTALVILLSTVGMGIAVKTYLPLIPSLRRRGNFSLSPLLTKEGLGEVNSFLLSTIIFFLPALIISVGYSNPFTQPIIDTLFRFLPGFGGLRETAKVIGFLAFSYALFFPIGTDYIFTTLFKNQKTLFSKITWYAGVPAIALATAGNMFFGFSGQLVPAEYPQSWYQASKIIHAGSAQPKVLFLPWHGYMATSFSGGIKIANPGKEFFGAEVIAGNDSENDFLDNQTQMIWDEKLFSWLTQGGSVDDDRDFLHAQNIEYLILAKESDWDRYGFLKHAESLEQIFDTPEITVYRVAPEQHGRFAFLKPQNLVPKIERYFFAALRP